MDLCEIQAGYNKFSENLRKFTPQAIQCAIFCGGSRCKYENSKAWPPVHMAIQNIFSHWVTDEVLAMARPNTAQIIKKDIIAQFQGWSIKTIINLQTPGEHASCGGPLEESGFTYDPNIFMKHGIYYYNFALKDYGDATMSKLLDMVKVVAFAVQEGRVAIHCHADNFYHQSSTCLFHYGYNSFNTVTYANTKSELAGYSAIIKEGHVFT